MHSSGIELKSKYFSYAEQRDRNQNKTEIKQTTKHATPLLFEIRRRQRRRAEEVLVLVVVEEETGNKIIIIGKRSKRQRN